nr:nitrosoguanidine resistance protein sng1 [Quercus suber]
MFKRMRARRVDQDGPNDRSPSNDAAKRHSDHEKVDANGQNGPKSDQNGDEEQQSAPPTPVGFWDPSLKHVRHEAMTKWTITTGVLMVFILCVLSLYWACLYHVDQNLGSLAVYVVDFDSRAAPYNNSGIQPVVGPLISQLARQTVASPSPALGWEVRLASEFGYDPIAVRQAIYNFDAWAAIIINSNATSMLYSAIQNGNTSYDPMGACQMVYIQARDETNYANYILPMINTFMTEATSMVGEQWAQMTMRSAATNNTLIQNLAVAPQAISPAIGFSMFNLRPFYPTQSTPAVTIGLIYLIIISFFSFAFYLPIHFKYLKPEGHPPLKFHHLVIWRWCATISAYFMLSLAYSLISLAFQINFSGGNPISSDTQVTSIVNGYSNPDAYGHGSFPVYWMLNFFGMIALGLACENVAMFVGQPWTGLWLIFWVITNVSTSFYDIELEPRFYYWGYAWPLHSIVEGSRQILFDLHSRIGLDFGILIAWGAVNTALFPFACYFMRWKSKHHVHECGLDIVDGRTYIALQAPGYTEDDNRRSARSSGCSMQYSIIGNLCHDPQWCVNIVLPTGPQQNEVKADHYLSPMF